MGWVLGSAAGAAGFADAGPEDPGTPGGGTGATDAACGSAGGDIDAARCCSAGGLVGLAGGEEARWMGGVTAPRAAVCREPNRNDSGPAGTRWLYAATCHTSAAATRISTAPIAMRSAGAIRVDSVSCLE